MRSINTESSFYHFLLVYILNYCILQHSVSMAHTGLRLPSSIYIAQGSTTNEQHEEQVGLFLPISKLEIPFS